MRTLIAGLLTAAATACTSASPSPEAVVEAVLRDTPLIDGHNDLITHFVDCRVCPRDLDAYDIGGRTEGRTDIPRWREGRIGAQLLNAGWVTGSEDADGTLQGFDLVTRLVERHRGHLTLATSAAEVRQAHAAGKIAIVLALENARRFQNSPVLVRQYARLGLRSNILAYNEGSDLADGADGPPRHGGLSEVGREIVEAMNRAGVLVDLSHASDETVHDVLDIAAAPVIFSHSSARALADVDRNVPDDVLRRLPDNGGIIMISFVDVYTTQAAASWLGRYYAAEALLKEQLGADTYAVGLQMEAWEREHPPPRVTVADVADHFDHVRRVAGVDHLGIGSDFDGDPSIIEGLEDVSKYPNLLLELARRGWGEEDLRKVAGENFLRVLEVAERVAAEQRDAPDGASRRR